MFAANVRTQSKLHARLYTGCLHRCSTHEWHGLAQAACCHMQEMSPTLKALASRRSFWRSALVRWRSRLCSKYTRMSQCRSWKCSGHMSSKSSQLPEANAEKVLPYLPVPLCRRLPGHNLPLPTCASTRTSASPSDQDGQPRCHQVAASKARHDNREPASGAIASMPNDPQPHRTRKSVQHVGLMWFVKHCS